MTSDESSSNFSDPEITDPDLSKIRLQAAYENFPVAFKILPRRYKRPLKALYLFARFVDDLGDNYTGDRLKALDWVTEQLGKPRGSRHPVIMEVNAAFHPLGGIEGPKACNPFLDLIEANRMDQTRNRYQTFEELMEYCELSANPIGRLVMRIFGKSEDEELLKCSDSVCSALQIIEHLQDIKEDYGKGRIYLPANDMKNLHCTEEDLARASASVHLRSVIRINLERARNLLEEGEHLIASLGGWGRVAVSGFVAGGIAAADSIVRTDYNTLKYEAKPNRIDFTFDFIPLLFQRQKENRWNK